MKTMDIKKEEPVASEEEIEAMLDEDNGFDSDTAYYEDANERMIDDIIAQKDAEIMSLKIQVEHTEFEIQAMTRIVSQLLSKSTPKNS